MSKPQDDGLPLRDHLLNLKRQTKVEHELLATAPKLPDGAMHVWSWFCEARSECGAEKITGETMRTVEWLLGISMELWERQAVRALDRLYFKVFK